MINYRNKLKTENASKLFACALASCMERVMLELRIFHVSANETANVSYMFLIFFFFNFSLGFDCSHHILNYCVLYKKRTAYTNAHQCTTFRAFSHPSVHMCQMECLRVCVLACILPPMSGACACAFFFFIPSHLLVSFSLSSPLRRVGVHQRSVTDIVL